jgi:FRG domain-containing protein
MPSDSDGVETKQVSSVGQFLAALSEDRQEAATMWFRGEPGTVSTPLVPKLYRNDHDENELLQNFRMRAPNLAIQWCPNREATDQWLFLAQHVGLPTRLLDWTDGALIGLYFAIREEQPVVWMLDTFQLNSLSITEETSGSRSFGLTWHDPKDGTINVAAENINSAWTQDSGRLWLPTAIPVTHIHPRMTVQRSCFTVQGRDKRSLADLAPGCLWRYEIDPDECIGIREELRHLGISYSTLWPDLDGLATELAELY